MRILYALAGAVIMVIVDLAGNLLAAAIQQQAFSDHFSRQSMMWLAGLTVAGAVLAYWLGGEIKIPTAPAPTAASAPRPSPHTTSITRLRALFSYGKLKGRGIHLRDILLIGSVIKIDTNHDS